MDIETKQPSFPYVSYPTFKTFIGHLHDTVVTDQIDNTMMPPKMSGGARYAVTSALKSLGLIDDQNNTTQKLKELVTAFNDKEWPEVVKTNILSVYSDIAKSFELKSATRKQVEGMFEDASPQMKDKYIRFFLSANKDAGIEYSPHLKIRRRLPKRRFDTATQKDRASSKERNKPPERLLKNDKAPPNMFDQPIPIASGSFIRVPRNITVNQVPLVQAAVAFIEAMAKQNKESK
jgi:hypothetical protein